MIFKGMVWMQLLREGGGLVSKQEDDKIQQIVELWDKGFLIHAIAVRAGCDRRTVKKILQINGKSGFSELASIIEAEQEED